MKQFKRAGIPKKHLYEETGAFRRCGTPTAFAMLRLGDVFQDFCGVAFGVNDGPNFFDFARFADKEGAADDAHEFATHELLLLPDAISFDGFVVGITEQGKVEPELGLEERLGSDRIGAHAEDGDFEPVELLFCVAKLGRLNGSTRGVGFRVEEEQDALVLEIFQSDGGAVVREEAEGGGFVAGSEHGIPRSTF